MTICYGWKGLTREGYVRSFLACASNPNWKPNPTYGNELFYPVDGETLLADNHYGVTPQDITPLYSQADRDAWLGSNGDSGPGCGFCYSSQPPTIKYDCLNGKCIDSASYKTDGIYKSLDDCQKVCSNGGSCGDGKICIDPNNYCPDGKACLDQSEVSQINSLIGKIRGEVC